MSKYKLLISDISIIIPVKNNQNGIDMLLNSFIDSLKEEKLLPKEIIIVDNNSNPEIFLPEITKQFSIPIKLEKCYKKGPAAARNLGANLAKGNWLFFTDSDCLFTESTLLAYFNLTKDSNVLVGKVIPLKNDKISNFYKAINLLNPTFNKDNEAQFIITANCLINKVEFFNVGGFDEYFKCASGEDIDLGIRLRKKNTILYVEKSVVHHCYNDNIIKMYKRFFRYGKTIRKLEIKHNFNIDINALFPKKTNTFLFYIFKLIAKIALKNALLITKYKD